ncbi:MAG: XdhC family protein [Candidatus Aminicenantes bacterium]|jgi:xanthine dehydrogenase accessory factor
MKNIFNRLLKEMKNTKPLALATIIETMGSSPQISGASAIFSTDGLVDGTLGGGILEARAEEEAIAALKDQESRLMPFSLDGAITSEEEAICGGEVTILIDTQTRDSEDTLDKMKSSIDSRQPGVLATTIDLFPKNRVILSRKWIEKSEIFGDGAAAKESPHYEQIKNSFRSGRPLLLEIQEEQEKGEKQEALSQKTLLFLEPLYPQSHLVIAGAGHIGKALAHLGNRLDFEVTVVDDRADFANPENIPEADHCVVSDIGRAIREIPKSLDTFIVIVTRGHSHDSDALRECISSNAGYIGMIGSERKIALMREKFLDEGWATEEQFDRVFAPIGLEIQSKTVEEIAVSIAAQLVLVRNQIQNKGRTEL